MQRKFWLLLISFMLMFSSIPAQVTAAAEINSPDTGEGESFFGSWPRLTEIINLFNTANRLPMLARLFLLYGGWSDSDGLRDQGSGSSPSAGSGGSGGGGGSDDGDDSDGSQPGILLFRIVPDYAEILVGEPVSFQAELVRTNGRLLTGIPVEWSASGGRIDPQGTFTADVPGTYTVTATALGKSASAQVAVAAPLELESIRVVPDHAEILTGETVQLRAELTGTDGQPLTDIPVEWSASGGRIDQRGTFTADEPGTYTVTATALGKTAAAQVTVTALPEVASIQVTPSGKVMLVGESFTFQAVLTGTDGQPLSDVSVAWSASGGRIDEQGRFTADVPGTYTVTATAMGKSATAQVTVIRYQPAPRPPELKLKPLPDRQDGEGDWVSFTVELTNPSVQNVVFAMQGAPKGVQIDPNTGKVEGTIADDNVKEPSIVKEFHVVVTASETTGLKRVVTEEFTWEIGQELKLKALPDRQSGELDWVSFKAELTNPNVSSVLFSIQGAPNGVQIDQYTGEIFGFIMDDNVDEENEPMSVFHVVVTVKETFGLKRVVTEEFTWEIGPEFKLKALPDRQNVEGDPVSFTVELTNPNIRFVQFSMLRAPNGVQIDSQTGEVFGTIAYDTVGDPNLRIIEFNVVVRATETAGLKRVSEVTFHWVISDKS